MIDEVRQFYLEGDYNKKNNRYFMCINEGWVTLGAMSWRTCETDWDLLECGRYSISGSWISYPDWYWVCLDGEWQLMNVSDLEGHL